MPSEYDALLAVSPDPASSPSEYDALLKASPAPTSEYDALLKASPAPSSAPDASPAPASEIDPDTQAALDSLQTEPPPVGAKVSPGNQPDIPSTWQAANTNPFEVYRQTRARIAQQNPDLLQGLPEPLIDKAGKVVDWGIDHSFNPLPAAIKAVSGSDAGYDVQRGVAKGVQSLAEGLTSPLGILTLGLGGAPKLIQKAAALGFAANMAKNAPDTIQAIGDATTAQDRAQKITEALGSAGMLFMLGKDLGGRPSEGGAAPEARATPSVTPVSPDTLDASHMPQTADAMRQMEADAVSSGEATVNPAAAPSVDAQIDSLLQRRLSVDDPLERKRLWDEADALDKGRAEAAPVPEPAETAPPAAEAPPAAASAQELPVAGVVEKPLDPNVVIPPEGSIAHSSLTSGTRSAKVTEYPDHVYLADIFNSAPSGTKGAGSARDIFDAVKAKGKPIEVTVGRRGQGGTTPDSDAATLASVYRRFGFKPVGPLGENGIPNRMRWEPPSADESSPTPSPLADESLSSDELRKTALAQNGSVVDAMQALHDQIQAPETSDTHRANLQAAFDNLGDTVKNESRRSDAEDFEQEQAGGKDELLDLTKAYGGLPALGSPHYSEHSGEIERVRSAHETHGSGGLYSQLFRKDAKSVDQLRQSINQHGFGFETPYDLLSALEDRLTKKEPVYGEKSEVPDYTLGAARADNPVDFPEQRTTGLKKAVVADERIQRGLDDLPPEERQPEEVRVQRAEDRVDADPTLGGTIVRRIVDEGQHAVSPDDAAVLLVERTRLGNQRQMWQDRIGNVEDEVEARAQLNSIEAQMERLDKAQRLAGSSWGRVGHLYQRMMRSDYTLEPMLSRERAVKGRALTPDEVAEVQRKADEIADAQKMQDYADDLDRQKAEQDAIQHVHDAATQAESPAPKAPWNQRVLEAARKHVERIKADAAPSLAELRRILGSETGGVGGTGGGPGMRGRKLNEPRGESNAALTTHLAKVIHAEIAEFALTKAEALQKIIALVGDNARPFFEKAWEQGNALFEKGLAKLSGDEKKAVRASRNTPKTPVDALATAKAEAVAGGPLSHKTVFDYVRSLLKSGVAEGDVMKSAFDGLKEHYPDLTQRDVNRAYVDYGKVRFPSQDALKTTERHLRSVVKISEDIDRLEQDKQNPLKQGYQPDKADQQIRLLQQRRSELLKLAHEPTAEELATSESKKITARKNAIADLDRELSTGEKRLREQSPPPGPELEKLNAELKAMRDLRGRLAAEENPVEPAQKALDDAMVARERASQTLDDISTGAKAPATPPKEALTQFEEDVRMETDAMKQVAAEMRREAKGKPDVDVRRSEQQVKSLEDQIERYRSNTEKLARGEEVPGKGKVEGPDTARVAALKEIRDSRKSMYEVAKKAGKPVLTPEEKLNAQRVKRWTDRADELAAKIKAGDFTKAPKVKVPLNSAAEKAKAVVEAKKLEFDRGVEKQRLANRTTSQKVWDSFVGIERAMKLTSDVVLSKLTIAAMVREGILTPAEEAVGGVFSKVFPRLAAKAAREGGFSPSAEAQAKAALFTDGMKDAAQNLKFRESGLELAHGKNRISPPAWWEYMGFLHSALKAPVKRAEFTRSLAKRIEWAQKQGRDVNDPHVMAELSQEAYVDGNRSIFLQDNALSDFMNSGLRAIETSKKFPMFGPGFARAVRFFVPIVKVPTNIVGEVATGVHGTVSGGGRAIYAYLKGIDDLPPQQADSIMRQLKKGSIGAALLLSGYYGYKGIGGFYHDHDQRDKSDVQQGRYRLGGYDLPGAFSHSTGAMLLNIGATVRRVEAESIKGVPRGFASGVGRAAAGVVGNLPFIPVASGAADFIHDENGFSKYLHYLVAGTAEPAILQHAAKLKDTPGSFPQNIFKDANKRKAETMGQALKVGIPGLRETVPLKK